MAMDVEERKQRHIRHTKLSLDYTLMLIVLLFCYAATFLPGKEEDIQWDVIVPVIQTYSVLSVVIWTPRARNEVARFCDALTASGVMGSLAATLECHFSGGNCVSYFRVALFIRLGWEIVKVALTTLYNPPSNLKALGREVATLANICIIAVGISAIRDDGYDLSGVVISDMVVMTVCLLIATVFGLSMTTICNTIFRLAIMTIAFVTTPDYMAGGSLTTFAAKSAVIFVPVVVSIICNVIAAIGTQSVANS